MSVHSPNPALILQSKRFNGLRNILEREGPFCKDDFASSPENLEFLQTECQVLIIGAGGLGCELLKDLALMGFGNLHVIDMDTIELSNLNRQFLFRRTDIGASKAECAARFINGRVPTCRVTPHFKKIQDFDESFYQQFRLIVCGLDSIVARRWINGMLLSMLRYEEDGTLDTSSIVPIREAKDRHKVHDPDIPAQVFLKNGNLIKLIFKRIRKWNYAMTLLRWRERSPLGIRTELSKCRDQEILSYGPNKVKKNRVQKYFGNLNQKRIARKPTQTGLPKPHLRRK